MPPREGKRMELIISLLSGAVGGNVAAKIFEKIDQGPLINSIAGIIGGGLGGSVLTSLGLGGMAGEGGMDIGTIVSQVAGGGVGGGIVLAVVSAIKNAMNK